MKKAFLILGLCASVAILSTSCNKECHCKQWLNDEVVSEYTFNNEEANVKCSSMNTVITIAGTKTGIECH